MFNWEKKKYNKVSKRLNYIEKEKINVDAIMINWKFEKSDWFQALYFITVLTP